MVSKVALTFEIVKGRKNSENADVVVLSSNRQNKLLTRQHFQNFNFRVKVSFFLQCTKMLLITLQNFNSQTCFSQFLWFFNLKWWCKGQITSRIHLSLSHAYKLTYFDRNFNGNRDVKFLECDWLLVQQCVKITLVIWLIDLMIWGPHKCFLIISYL